MNTDDIKSWLEAVTNSPVTVSEGLTSMFRSQAGVHIIVLSRRSPEQFKDFFQLVIENSPKLKSTSFQPLTLENLEESLKNLLT